MSNLACWVKDCPYRAVYSISGAIGRGKVEFPGINDGGVFYAVPTSSTGTETEDLSLYACQEHGTYAQVRSMLARQNETDRRLVRLGQQEASLLGPWRILEYSRKRLPR